MNGPQDAGGMMGFGPVVPEPVTPVFHGQWERRAFAVTLAMGMTGSWNIDISRHARERIPPAEYWAASYYEIWLKGLERLLAETGLASAEEIAAGRSLTAARPVTRVAAAVMIPDILARGGPADRPAATAPLFAAGDKIRTRNMNPEGHTRLPRYLRGCPGTIAIVHGCHVLPDSSAHRRGDDPHWLYAVRFSASDVFGVPGRDEIVADLWEPYLEAA
jgi:nitrile hydratase subunit beta